MAILAGMRFLMQGAEYQALNTPYDVLPKIRDDIAKNNMSESLAYDRILQMQAMITHNVSKNFSGDLALAARRVGGKLLVLAGNKDAVVTPGPVLAFAKQAGAQALEFPNCGHDIPRCSASLINPAVRDFLTR
ncbi:MAG: alpha/beta hydrolase [Pseudomonadota bacterium]